MSFKISVDKDACIGCGLCTSCSNFKMDDSNKAEPINSNVEDVTCENEAAESCPVDAIKVEGA